MATHRGVGCPDGRSGLLTAWDLDAHDFRAIITIQGSRMPTAVAPRRSLFFCGARLSDFHGLLVNVDPRRDLFRIWDLDVGTAAGLGTRFLDQRDGLIWVTNFGRSLKTVVPLLNIQATWELGFQAAGLAALRDGTVMLLSGGTPTARVHRLDPATRRLISWMLPQETAPFDGVATPGGRFFFARRRPVGGVARFDPRTGALREWILPPGSNPQMISRDRLGRIWFSDANFNNRIGRLDPRRNTLALFVKEGVVTFSVRPVDRRRIGRVVAAADLLSFVDVLCPTEVPEMPVQVCQTVLTPSRRELAPPVLSAIPVSTLVITPTLQRVHPVDPPALFRYPTPVVAPIDLVEHFGAVYVTAGTFNERAGPSRLFRLGIRGAAQRRPPYPQPPSFQEVAQAPTAPPEAPTDAEAVVGRRHW